MNDTLVVLGTWYTPAETLEIFDSQTDVGKASVVVSRKSKRLREAWILAQICKLLGVKRLGLSLTEQFDGYYEFQGKTRYVEITELLDKGRRRGDEYASGSMVGSLPINTEDIRARILDVVRGKSKRSKLRFESGKVVDLIVYQNLNIYRNVTAEIEEGVWSAFSFQHPFARIYVLNQLHNVILGYLMKKGTQTECIHLVKNSEGGGKRRDQ